MDKANVLLLHGAVGATKQFAQLVPLLAERYRIHILDFEGHGAEPGRERPYRMEYFVGNVSYYLEQNSIEQTHIFGYSMGGYVACLLALKYPDSVQSIATLGTRFRWDPEVAAREAGMLDTEKIKAKVPHFAAILKERHSASGWENVVNSTREMLLALGEAGGLEPGDLAHLAQPVRIMIGDRDTTVSVEESHEMYRALTKGQLEVLPGTRHELERVSLDRLAFSLQEFFG